MNEETIEPVTDLRVLFVEDNPLDAELAVRELTRSGFHPEWKRVETHQEYKSRLSQDPPDVIISDHVMPQFSSAEALHCLQESGLPIPFIVVSCAIGEEQAVELMRNGAADFLMKDRLGRLGEAVRRVLEQQRLRKEHAAVQKVVEEQTRNLVASHQALRALASELTLAEQRERKRLAGELHDYLAQMLSLGRIKMSQFRSKLDGAPAAVTLAREVDELFIKALNYTRSLIAKLSPPVLEELGLPAALTWLGEQMPLHGLIVEVKLAHEKVPLPDDQAILLFQSVRELLINVAKHAGTNCATVALRIEDRDTLCIEVKDSGNGFDVTTPKPGGEHFGLLSIRERMEAMGGRLDVKSIVDQGTTMTLILPLKKKEGA